MNVWRCAINRLIYLTDRYGWINTPAECVSFFFSFLICFIRRCRISSILLIKVKDSVSSFVWFGKKRNGTNWLRQKYILLITLLMLYDFRMRLDEIHRSERSHSYFKWFRYSLCVFCVQPITNGSDFCIPSFSFIIHLVRNSGHVSVFWRLTSLCLML